VSVMFVNALATFRRRKLCAEAAQARLKSGSSGRPPSFPFAQQQDSDCTAGLKSGLSGSSGCPPSFPIAQQQDSDCTDADEQLWTVVKPKKGWRSLTSTRSMQV
jgi:hypothetical protein